MVPLALIGAALVLLALAGVIPRVHDRFAKPIGAHAMPAPRWGAGRRGRVGVVGFLADRRWARITVAATAGVLVVAAVAAAAYPFLTDQYTESVQKRLRREFVAGETRQAYLAKRVEVGDSLTRIRIPAIDVDTIVVEGTTEEALRAGAGHFPETPLPCDLGNVAIAGHRTTFGKPFARLGELKAGDEITLETPIGSCSYRITEAPFEVNPNDVWVATPTPGPNLTLTTCHPEHSARQRLVVKAERTSVQEGTRS